MRNLKYIAGERGARLQKRTHVPEIHLIAEGGYFYMRAPYNLRPPIEFLVAKMLVVATHIVDDAWGQGAFKNNRAAFVSVVQGREIIFVMRDAHGGVERVRRGAVISLV